MRVALLEISNFRGIRSGKIALRDHTVLIGPNNSCKTTVIEALTLVLGRDRLVRTLTEHDFFGSAPEAASRITITATVTGFDPPEITRHPEWFGDRRGVPFWFDPETEEAMPEQTHERQLLASRITFAARFNSDTLEVDTLRYFDGHDDIDVFNDDHFVAVPPKLIRDLGLFLVSASRSWDRMLSFASELFRRVIRSADGLPAATILAERERVRAPDKKLEEDARIAPVVNEVNAEMGRLLGHETPLKLRVTATDSAAVLEAITAHFANGDAPSVPAKRQGSGLISLQSLFLLLHFGQRRIAAGESFLMALEEPELHLPPAVQRRVLSRLQALSTQTIVTTHSPLVAGFCDATSLLVVRMKEGELDVRPLLPKALTQAATNATRKLFQINRTETAAAVMSECVLVPEGRYDFDWLTLLLRVAELHGEAAGPPCLFGVRIGLVPTDSAKVKETCGVLGKAHPLVCALVDGDADGIGYADALDEAEAGAARVLLWPTGWTIEDVVGWVIEADRQAALQQINSDLTQPSLNRAELVTRLKSEDRAAHGLKGDGVAREIIANALSERPACRIRARELLHAMSEACLGTDTARFNRATRQADLPWRLTFTP
jgi:hypothetical protein